ncbi:MAG: hypothetical protein HXY23_04240 [Parvularculaceae bacterium]|nr:hypothetical protein [Parvularculaceae bacterium]
MDAPETESTPRDGFSGLAAAIGARNLIIVIITMPLAFIAVVAASLALLGKPGATKDEPASSVVRSVAAEDVLVQPEPLGATPPLAASAKSSSLVLSADEDISAMALDGDRLVLRVKGPSGGALVVYDLARGAEIQRIRIIENPVGDGGL